MCRAQTTIWWASGGTKHAGIGEIFRSGAQKSAEDAASYVQALKTAKRYQRDVY